MFFVQLVSIDLLDFDVRDRLLLIHLLECVYVLIYKKYIVDLLLFVQFNPFVCRSTTIEQICRHLYERPTICGLLGLRYLLVPFAHIPNIQETTLCDLIGYWNPETNFYYINYSRRSLWVLYCWRYVYITEVLIFNIYINCIINKDIIFNWVCYGIASSSWVANMVWYCRVCFCNSIRRSEVLMTWHRPIEES